MATLPRDRIRLHGGFYNPRSLKIQAPVAAVTFIPGDLCTYPVGVGTLTNASANVRTTSNTKFTAYIERKIGSALTAGTVAGPFTLILPGVIYEVSCNSALAATGIGAKYGGADNATLGFQMSNTSRTGIAGSDATAIVRAAWFISTSAKYTADGFVAQAGTSETAGVVRTPDSVSKGIAADTYPRVAVTFISGACQLAE